MGGAGGAGGAVDQESAGALEKEALSTAQTVPLRESLAMAKKIKEDQFMAIISTPQ